MNDRKSIITVIIPTFRRPQLLKKAIESVLAQTYSHFLLCIYDNASKDETGQIVAQYRDERIHYHVHPENVGMNNNYNYALERVETPFFVFLSDDDLFMPTFLEEAIKGFEQYPNAGVFVGGMIYMDHKKRLMGGIFNRQGSYIHYTSKEMIHEILQGRFESLINSMLFRREVRDKIGFFNQRIWLDVDFVTRAILEFSVIFSPVSCVVYRLQSNISHKAIIAEYWDMKKAMHDRILHSHMIASSEKNIAAELLRSEMRRFIYRITYDRFVTRRFSESLAGFEILQQLSSLNTREKIVKFISKILLNNNFIVCLFIVLVNSFRFVSRFSHFRKLKKELGKKNYQAFVNLVSNSYFQ